MKEGVRPLINCHRKANSTAPFCGPFLWRPDCIYKINLEWRRRGGWGWGSVALCVWVIGWGLMSHWRDVTHLKHTCYFSCVIRPNAGNRQIWVMTSCEITWHCKRSIHIECSSKWPTLSSRNRTVWIIQVLTLLVGSRWKINAIIWPHAQIRMRPPNERGFVTYDIDVPYFRDCP